MAYTLAIPRSARMTRPFSMSCRRIREIALIGTAKLMPADWPTWLTIAVFMPITCPLELSSGPPELPGLIAASVWMIPLIVRPFLALIDRSRLLTIPEVSVRSSPNGLPRARIFWPTITLEESPSFKGNSFSGGTWIKSTATSFVASAPMILASCAEPSKSLTWIETRLASSPWTT